MSTCRCYIMGKIQKYEVLTMEISEELKELNPADQQLFLACYNLDIEKAAGAILNCKIKCPIICKDSGIINRIQQRSDI